MKKRADGLAAWSGVAADNMLFNFLPRGFSIEALPEAGAMRIMPSRQSRRIILFPDGLFCVRQKANPSACAYGLKNRRQFLC